MSNWLSRCAVSTCFLAACAMGDGGEMPGPTAVDRSLEPHGDAYEAAHGDGPLDGVNWNETPDVVPEVDDDADLGGQRTGLCGNGVDDDRDGLPDCSDLGCLSAPLCCVPADSSAFDGDFASCDDLAACGWNTFFTDDDGPAVRMVSDAVVLGGDGVGEVGFYSAPFVGLAGQPTFAFVAGFAPGICDVDDCRQVFGVAFTVQQSIGTGTGVLPTLGILLDGEQGYIHFINSGRVEWSLELEHPADVFNEERLYAVRLNSNGSVSFWSQLSPSLLGRPNALPEEPTYWSPLSADISRAQVRVAAFGRLLGGDVVTMAGMHLERQVCDIPDGWSRASRRAVLSPTPDTSPMIRNPSVAPLDDDLLVMVYETGAGLGSALSDDDGLSWTEGDAVLTENSSTQYGRVTEGAPTLLRWTAPGDESGARYHMWYVGEAEVGPDTPRGVLPTAILHAESSDGLNWHDADTPIALEATDELGDWMYELAHPTVAVDPDGGVRMWFTGRHPHGRDGALLTAYSENGKDWEVDIEPIELLDSEGGDDELNFERDGRSEPMVLSRGGVFHLWYVGHDASRTALGYAVSGDGVTWERFGEVLSADMAWEASRLGGPTVLAVPDSGEQTETFRMWYHGGSPERERIGLATRLIPVRE